MLGAEVNADKYSAEQSTELERVLRLILRGSQKAESPTGHESGGLSQVSLAWSVNRV